MALLVTNYSYVACTLFVLLALLLILQHVNSRGKLPLPPGPTQWPIIGNTLQIKKEYTWRQYLEWAKQYGPFYSLNIAGIPFIILGDAATAQDLLNKRSIKSSNRPSFIMADLVTKGMHMLLRPYDVQYRLHQRMHAPVLSTRAAVGYAKVYELESTHMLVKFLSQGPEADFSDLFANCNLSVIYTLIYGTKITTGKEQCIVDSRVVQQEFQRMMTPGTYIVEALTFLNKLPASLAPWKNEAEKMYETESELHLRNLDAGLSRDGWNFAKEFSASPAGKNLSRVELAYSLGILTNAGFDTIKLMLEWFVVAMLNNPQYMTRAQSEIDSTIGRDRLPVLADKERLPIITAIVEETLRWRSILNGGFPHVATEEDEYKGYRIPKGAILLPQFWAIDHDESVYHKPDEFNPERWLSGLSEEAQKTGAINGSCLAAFGYGRRICTGRNIARNTLWLIVTRLLWAFDIKHATDAQGNQIPVDPMAMHWGIDSKVLPFKARFELRGEGAADVIQKTWEEADTDVLGSIGNSKVGQMEDPGE